MSVIKAGQRGLNSVDVQHGTAKKKQNRVNHCTIFTSNNPTYSVIERVGMRYSFLLRFAF